MMQMGSSFDLPRLTDSRSWCHGVWRDDLISSSRNCRLLVNSERHVLAGRALVVIGLRLLESVPLCGTELWTGREIFAFDWSGSKFVLLKGGEGNRYGRIPAAAARHGPS